jgi:protein gp37
VICGGESGPGFRPMAPAWARQMRDQCHDLCVPFFMKQMAAKAPIPPDLAIRKFPASV